MKVIVYILDDNSKRMDGMSRTKNSDNVAQWTDSGDTAQQWSIESYGN
jgi:hypothetical protein